MGGVEPSDVEPLPALDPAAPAVPPACIPLAPALPPFFAPADAAPPLAIVPPAPLLMAPLAPGIPLLPDPPVLCAAPAVLALPELAPLPPALIPLFPAFALASLPDEFDGERLSAQPKPSIARARKRRQPGVDLKSCMACSFKGRPGRPW